MGPTWATAQMYDGWMCKLLTSHPTAINDILLHCFCICMQCFTCHYRYFGDGAGCSTAIDNIVFVGLCCWLSQVLSFHSQEWTILFVVIFWSRVFWLPIFSSLHWSLQFEGWGISATLVGRRNVYSKICPGSMFMNWTTISFDFVYMSLNA